MKSKTVASIILSVPLTIFFVSLGWAAFVYLALPFALCAVSILSIVALVLFAIVWTEP